MTHSDLVDVLADKISKMNEFDMDILEDIVAGIALKDDSLYQFYRELTTCGRYLDIALVKEISEKYSVPSLYRSHVDKRFDLFKENIKIVCTKNKELVSDHKRPGLIPDRWLRDKKPMFGSTEMTTIEKAGGLGSICDKFLMVGQFDYLKLLFEEAATDVSKVKYALIIKDTQKKIGGSK